MPTALGNGSRPRGRGRGRMTMPGGSLPRGGNRATPLPRQTSPGDERLPGNGGTTAPARGRGRGAQGQGQPQRPGGGKAPVAQGKIGVGGSALPGPGGAQLARRVAAGKITQEQAEQTMKQRQTLAKAFGKDWRDKLKVGGKSFTDVRQGLSKNPKDPTLAAINKKLKDNRKKTLEAARSGGKKKGAAVEEDEG